MADEFSTWRPRWSWAAFILAALLAGGRASEATQIRVDGSAEAVRIDVVDAPVRDVLDLLQTKFGLRYRSQSTLDTGRTIRIVAPLRQAVARLLEGYDFVIAVTSLGVDVLIVQQSASGNVLMPRPVPPVAPAPLPTLSREASRRERD